eukprot:6732450-Lingulodinium_polyedra.AAC.1
MAEDFDISAIEAEVDVEAPLMLRVPCDSGAGPSGAPSTVQPPVAGVGGCNSGSRDKGLCN